MDTARIEQIKALIAQYSEKAATACSEVAPEILSLIPHETATRWAEMGCAVARTSGSAAIKYFRESPRVLAAFPEKADIEPALQIGLQLASRDYGISLEYFRQCPVVLSKIGSQRLGEWAEHAADLAAQDYGTAIEFLKESPKILDHLTFSQLPLWSRLGLALARQDQKNKDFLSLEFFRLSPELLAQVPYQEIRPALLEVALHLATASSNLALEFLKQCPLILGVLGRYEVQSTVLALAKTLAESAPSAVPELIGHSAEAFTLAEGSLSRFEQWARKGIQIAAANPERAAAYFSLKLKISHDELRLLSKGVFLKDISRLLRFYAEGLCGRPVEIRGGAGSSAVPTTPDGLITLPEKIARFAQTEDNFRFYKVMTLHEAGHLEFDSYRPVSLSALHEIDGDPEREIASLLSGLSRESALPVNEVLSRLPDPPLANSLWMIAEEGRIDFLLRNEYPGIRKDMDFVIGQELRSRPPLSDLPPRQAILEALLQLSVADSTEAPLGIAETVSRAYALLKKIHNPGATVNDTLRVTCSLYLLITKYLREIEEEPVDRAQPPVRPPEAAPPDEASGIGHGLLGNLTYRSPLDLHDTRPGAKPRPSEEESPPPDREENPVPIQAGASDLKKTEDEKRPPTSLPQRTGAGVYFYNEWDVTAGDYKARWCRLEEKGWLSQSPESAEQIQTEYKSMIALLRRYFEYIRPQALKKVKRQEYGDEIDLDSALDSMAERKAGAFISDRVYTLRVKKARDVSVAFLIDMSGSTSQQIWPGIGLSSHAGSRTHRRVIDVEKEGLLVLGEALAAVGDEFGMFGFSGQSKNQVDFYVVKDFEEPYNDPVRRRIAAIQPLGQNRDGTAIRHVTTRLMERPALIKLLILLSDGKPLDEEYDGLYSLEDTRIALLEARSKRIHPFCITVDRDAGEYIRAMYGEVRYTVISNITTLPQKLPRIYKRLTT